MAGAAVITLERWQALLTEVIAIGGVRGAVVISTEDGLVVHEAAMEGVPTGDLAALAAAVINRCAGVLTALDDPIALMVTLATTGGNVVAAHGSGDLWLVAVTEPAAELGRLRLLLGDLVPEIA